MNYQHIMDHHSGIVMDAAKEILTEDGRVLDSELDEDNEDVADLSCELAEQAVALSVIMNERISFIIERDDVVESMDEVIMDAAHEMRAMPCDAYPQIDLTEALLLAEYFR